MDSQQHRIQEDAYAKCRVDSFVVVTLVTMKMMTQLNTISSCTNVSNIETECIGIVSVCNTDVSHQNI